MPRALVPLVFACTLWNLASVFWGVEIVFRARSLAGDFMAGMITLAIVLFGVATVEIQEPGKFLWFRRMWWLVLACGFVFAVIGNFSFLPRLFHSPETPPTPRAIFWDEIVSERGILIFVFTLLCSVFASLHGKLPRESGRLPFQFFRQG